MKIVHLPIRLIIKRAEQEQRQMAAIMIPNSAKEKPIGGAPHCHRHAQKVEKCDRRALE
jgi:co-chaperonin GroES (HSP10)